MRCPKFSCFGMCASLDPSPRTPAWASEDHSAHRWGILMSGRSLGFGAVCPGPACFIHGTLLCQVPTARQKSSANLEWLRTAGVATIFAGLYKSGNMNLSIFTTSPTTDLTFRVCLLVVFENYSTQSRGRAARVEAALKPFFAYEVDEKPTVSGRTRSVGHGVRGLVVLRGLCAPLSLLDP